MYRFPSLVSLSPSQAGFRAGYSTVSHALASHASAQKHTNLHQVFLDLKAAYDRVSIPLLIEKLIKRKTPTGITSLIISLFTNCAIQIVVNGILTDPIQTQRGLFQGSLLSPILFDIFIDDLALIIDQYSTLSNPSPGLFFADDIKLQHNNQNQMQKMLDDCYTWTLNNGMAFGISKCGTLGLTKFKINDETIPYTPTYKYLGFPHVQNGIDWEQHIKHLSSKAIQHLAAISDTSRLWNPSTKLTIFKTFIRPKLEYGAPLIYHWQKTTRSSQKLSPLNQAQAHSMSWITNNRQHKVSSAICGIGTISHRIMTLACGFVHHLNTLTPTNPAKVLWYLYKDKPPWSSKLLLPNTFNHNPIYNLPPLPTQSLQRTTNSKLLNATQLHLRSLGILSKYILPFSRKTRDNSYSAGPDFSLLKVHQPNLLRWRLNCFGARSICPTCKSLFRRDHIIKCNLINDQDNILSVNKEALEKDIKTYTDLRNTKYNIIDSLINHQHYDIANSILERIESSLKSQ